MATAELDYKARKEAFVSNLSGSTITDINTVALVPAVSQPLKSRLEISLTGLGCCPLVDSFADSTIVLHPYSPASLVVDFLLNVCAFLFAVTAYNSATFLLSITLATPAILVLLLDRTMPVDTSVSTKKGGRKLKTVSAANHDAPSRLVARPFLTHYRAAMMISTFLSILAVDFRIFPRTLCQSRDMGSLVDGSWSRLVCLLCRRSLCSSTLQNRQTGHSTKSAHQITSSYQALDSSLRSRYYSPHQRQRS